jgi:Peptidase A4 family
MARLSLRPRLIIAMVAGALALVAAPAALADSVTSSNWAGYAAHRGGVRFKRVTATWRQPTTLCSQGRATFSSMWVGLGGYSVTSEALEQIGSEVDCTARGRTVSSVWYELVPAASRTIRMLVRPGDRLRATVTVIGHKVTLSLRDLTRRRSFTKTVRASIVDVTSAEWIVETPSVCSGSFCRVLPLADFGQAAFTAASATSTTGVKGAIANGHWTATKIILAEEGRHFIGQGAADSLATAAPSSLSPHGGAFSVNYRAPQTTTTTSPLVTTSVRQAGVRAGQASVTMGRAAKRAVEARLRGGRLVRARRAP